MTTDEIKRRLARPAVRFSAGGFRPTERDDESWLGRVFLYREDEGVPLDAAGEEMLPFAQICLPVLPWQSPLLGRTRILAVFLSRTLPEPFEAMGRSWLLREYGLDESVVRKAVAVPSSPIKPLPLRAELVAEDFPLWDTGDIPADVASEILRLEGAGEIESYHDVATHCHTHKLGGYPSFCQSGVDPGDGFEFVFQISSDAKAHFNVVDNGSLMFWKSARTGQWLLYYDFY